METGVAAGFSSRAILSALHQNGAGILWSSDFPLFRLEEPEQNIGVLVEPPLRNNWRLFLKGDRVNIPQILEQMQKVDFFHYDSDKSKSGREYAFQQVRGKLSDDAIVVFDDIQDNLHFKELVEFHGFRFKVFSHEEKWIGVIFLNSNE
jgi:predicted O-methyltransferase YrrM